MAIRRDHQEGRIVEIRFAQRPVRGTAGVHGNAVRLHAIRRGPVGPQAPQQVPQTRLDFGPGNQVARVLDHVGEVARPEGAVVALPIRRVKPSAVPRLYPGTGEQFARPGGQPRDIRIPAGGGGGEDQGERQRRPSGNSRS
jgi:hypothetical protein